MVFTIVTDVDNAWLISTSPLLLAVRLSSTMLEYTRFELKFIQIPSQVAGNNIHLHSDPESRWSVEQTIHNGDRQFKNLLNPFHRGFFYKFLPACINSVVLSPLTKAIGWPCTLVIEPTQVFGNRRIFTVIDILTRTRKLEHLGQDLTVVNWFHLNCLTSWLLGHDTTSCQAGKHNWIMMSFSKSATLCTLQVCSQ